MQSHVAALSDSSSASSYESSSSEEEAGATRDGRRRRRTKKPKLSLRTLQFEISASVERAPPRHRDRAALEVAELLLRAYPLPALRKETKAEIERLASSFYASPSALPPSLVARSRLEGAAAGVLPEAKRKSFLRAVKDASIAERRATGRTASEGGGRGGGGKEGNGGDGGEGAAGEEAERDDDDDGDGKDEKDDNNTALFLPSGLFELVPDAVRRVADFLPPIDVLAAAGVCAFFVVVVVVVGVFGFEERKGRRRRKNSSFFPLSTSL